MLFGRTNVIDLQCVHKKIFCVAESYDTHSGAYWEVKTNVRH